MNDIINRLLSTINTFFYDEKDNVKRIEEYNSKLTMYYYNNNNEGIKNIIVAVDRFIELSKGFLINKKKVYSSLIQVNNKLWEYKLEQKCTQKHDVFLPTNERPSTHYNPNPLSPVKFSHKSSFERPPTAEDIEEVNDP